MIMIVLLDQTHYGHVTVTILLLGSAAALAESELIASSSTTAYTYIYGGH